MGVRGRATRAGECAPSGGRLTTRFAYLHLANSASGVVHAHVECFAAATSSACSAPHNTVHEFHMAPQAAANVLVTRQVGNFRVEPPGLFRGRGEHPRMGKIKRRVYPRDITINIGEGEPIPEHPYPGQTWKEVKHDHTVTWLAYWKDTISTKDYKWVTGDGGGSRAVAPSSRPCAVHAIPTRLCFKHGSDLDALMHPSVP